MAKLPDILIVWIVLLIFACNSISAETLYNADNGTLHKVELEIENTADNPRLVNLTPQQFKSLEVMEKRLYRMTFDSDNNMDRIERLELEYFNEIRKGTATTRINNLKIASGRAAIRGSAMTPMMMNNFNSRYINQRPEIYHDDVGIIDGLVRLWWPDFYAKITEYRKYKEANFYQYN